MKKILCSLLLLFALLLASLSAWAKEINALDLTETHDYETASSLCFIDDTLYMLGSYGVYAFKDGQLSTVVDLAQANKYRYDSQKPQAEEEASAWAQAISFLFTDGNTLYGLHPYSGMIYQIAAGRLNAYAQLPEDLLVAAGDTFREIKGAVFESRKLFLLLGSDDDMDYDKTELVSFDLESLESETCSPEGVKSIAGGPEGKLLIFVQLDENAIWQYDVNSDQMEMRLVSFDENTSPSGMTCYQQKPVYYLDNRVVTVDEKNDIRVKAYLPILSSFASTQAACSKNGIYAYPDSNYVFLRDISQDGEAETTVLTLMGNVTPRLIADFSIDNPDIAIVTVQPLQPDAFRQAAITGDSGVDLFTLSATGEFAAMKEKGYIASLGENEALVSDAKKLYPAIQEVIFNQDSLMGYPIFFDPLSWTVNETQWERLGLGAYPETYGQLLDKIAVWLQDYAASYPEYSLSDIQQIGLNNAVFMMVEAYIIQNVDDEGRLSFDTPSFRTLLNEVSEHAELLSEDQEQWGMPLITSYYQGFGTSYADEDLISMMLPPTIDADSPQVLSANMEILCVNVASQQRDAASRFIAYYASHLPDSTRYAMYPDLNEPVEYANYESRLATLQEELNALQTRLETVNQNEKAEIEDDIIEKQAMIEHVTANRWDISAESIETYRSIAQHLRIPFQSALLIQGEGSGYDILYSVVSQHCADGLEAGEIDALITELDRVATMINLENM